MARRSVSSNTSYIESAAGVGEGARTGLASVVTGVLFLFATFLAPLVRGRPLRGGRRRPWSSSGFLMMQQVKGIDWDDLEIAIPAFLTIVLMPFTYSITVGIGAGFVVYVLIKVVLGKAAQVHPLMWAVAGAVRRLLRASPRSSRSSVGLTPRHHHHRVCRVAPMGAARHACRPCGEARHPRVGEEAQSVIGSDRE